MRVVVPLNQGLLLERAHDIRVVKTSHALARRGHEVWLLAGRTPATPGAALAYYGLDEHPNLHLCYLPMLRRPRGLRVSWHGLFLVAALVTALALRRHPGVDVILVPELPLARWFLRWRGLLTAPIVLDLQQLTFPAHGGTAPQRTAREARVLTRVDGIATSTAALAAAVERLYGVAAPVMKVPLAADPFPGLPAPTDGRPRGPRFAAYFVGRLYPLQGVDLIFDALPLLPEVEARIIGGPAVAVEPLRRRAVERGIADRVQFHGFVRPDQMGAVLRGADLLLLPARNAGRMPVVGHTKLYEYLQVGRPIVAADLPSIREELTDGVNAILVPPDSAPALAAGIRRVVDDPALAQALARRAHADAANFSYEKRAERLVRLFHKVRER